MEDAQRTFNDVVAALRVYATDLYDQAQNFSNVEPDVQDDITRNDKLAKKIAAQRAELEELKTRNAARLVQMQDGITTMRRENEKDAEGWIDAIDDISMAKHHYQTIMDSVGEQHQNVANLVSSETDGYGYTGKRLLSLSVTYEALKAAMASGKPFMAEMDAFKNEVGESPDFATIAKEAEGAATRGVATDAWISMAARNVAAGMADVATTQTTDITNSWFSSLKFTVRKSQDETQALETRRETEDRFLAHVARREYGRALEALDDAVERANVADISAGSNMRTAADSFRDKAADRIAVEHLQRYCDAAFLCTKFHFVEGVLSV